MSYKSEIGTLDKLCVAVNFEEKSATPYKKRMSVMAGSYLTQLVIMVLNIFLRYLFVAANTDFCGSVFESQVSR